MGFEVTFSNVLLTLLYIIPGYIVAKMGKASADHLSTVSVILVYICSPCMIMSSFLSLEYSAERLLDMGLFFVLTFILQCAFMLILYCIFRKKFNLNKYRILTIGAVLGNVGFFGLPIINALLPENPEVMCYSSVYVISMNILVFTAGIYCLTGKKEYLSVRSAVFNPTMLGLAVGLPLFLTNADDWMPQLLKNGIGIFGKMTTPLCMLILGVRLANVSLKKLLSRPFVYLICAAKLILFPLFCYLAVYFLPLPESFKKSMLVLSGVPCASVIMGLAEIHHSETELAANCVLLSTLLCLFTIPLLTLIAS